MAGISSAVRRWRFAYARRCPGNHVGNLHSFWSAVPGWGVVRDLSSFVYFRLGMPCFQNGVLSRIRGRQIFSGLSDLLRMRGDDRKCRDFGPDGQRAEDIPKPGE